MATMNVSLPDAMKVWAERQSDSGRYSNVSDYVRDLIRRDKDRQGRIAAMQQLVDEARAAGVGSMTVDDIKAEGRRRAGKHGV